MTTTALGIRLFADRAARRHGAAADRVGDRHQRADADDEVAADDLEPDRDAQRHPRRDRAAAAGGRPGRTRQRCRAPADPDRAADRRARRGLRLPAIRQTRANAVTVSVSSTTGMFVCMPRRPSSWMLTRDGDPGVDQVGGQHRARRSGPVSPGAHAVGTMLMPLGGFATGIVPPTGIANGSTGYRAQAVRRRQRRRQHGVRRVHVRPDASAQPVSQRDGVRRREPSRRSTDLADSAQQRHRRTRAPRRVLHLSDGQRDRCNGTPFTFVLDVAVTLTVETEQIDPVTQAKADGDEGAPERVAAKRLQRLDAGRHGLHRSHSVDAGDGDGAVTLTS